MKVLVILVVVFQLNLLPLILKEWQEPEAKMPLVLKEWQEPEAKMPLVLKGSERCKNP